MRQRIRRFGGGGSEITEHHITSFALKLLCSSTHSPAIMEDNAELESFRRQWREEVARRNNKNTHHVYEPVRQPQPPRFPPTHHAATERKEEEEENEPDESEIVSKVDQLHLQPEAPAPGTADEDVFHAGPQKEPSSALEHFERAVQREAEGSLGDSLQHYRKAYRVCLQDSDLPYS